MSRDFLMIGRNCHTTAADLGPILGIPVLQKNQKLHKNKRIIRTKIWPVLTIPYLLVCATSITPVKDLIQLDDTQELLVSYLRARSC